MIDAKFRAWWWFRQSLDGTLAGSAPAAVLARTGSPPCMRIPPGGPRESPRQADGNGFILDGCCRQINPPRFGLATGGAGRGAGGFWASVFRGTWGGT